MKFRTARKLTRLSATLAPLASELCDFWGEQRGEHKILIKNYTAKGTFVVVSLQPFMSTGEQTKIVVRRKPFVVSSPSLRARETFRLLFLLIISR